MTRRVTAHVYVTAKDGSHRGWLQPGDEVPSWASVDDRLLEGAADASSPQGSSVQGAAAEPPRSGKGSGVEAWQRYADAQGVGYDSEMSRDDIIAAVDAANTPSSEG